MNQNVTDITILILSMSSKNRNKGKTDHKMLNNQRNLSMQKKKKPVLCDAVNKNSMKSEINAQ